MDKIQYILDYQFPEQMKARVQERLNCNDFHMTCIEDALKDYFIARYEFHNTGKPVTMPSVAVDELWHEFIIFTRDYHDFCNNVYGAYLHHDPYGKFDLRESDDVGLKNMLQSLRKNKGIREYNSEDINILNKNIEEFFLLFSMDYLINNIPYENAIEESFKDIEGVLNDE